MLSAVDLIEKKREGLALTAEEIRFLIRGYTEGEIPDYQMSAFLMAVYFRGMTEAELAVFTEEMLHSGEVLDLSALGDTCCDKHSTGGIADTVTLVAAPLAAACGVRVAKLSGRGLGFTGGTIDKLESIPNFRTEIEVQSFIRQVEELGIAVCGASENVCPADKKIYALRDVTGTVPSIPLIASSIMSKKLAAGAPNIVLDVKCGTGAFIKDVDNARLLAETMVRIGHALGKNTVALVTDMNQPLGDYVGNALEVMEAIEILKGQRKGRLYELSVRICGEMLLLCSRADNTQDACRMAEEAIAGGKALSKLKELIIAQGGDGRVIEDVTLLPKARYTKVILAERDGYISGINAEQIGHSARLLGAGRLNKEDVIDLAVGLEMKVSLGDHVKAGDALVTVYYNDEEKALQAEREIRKAIEIGINPVKPELIYDIITC